MRIEPRISLTFNGECDAAFALYQKCLGGTLTFRLTWGDSQMAEQAPAEWRDRVVPLGTTYVNLADPSKALDGDPHPDSRRYDAAALAPETIAAALAAHDLLASHGWPEVRARAAELAASLANGLAEAGHTVAPRGRTTLVSWEDSDPESTRTRLADAGVIIRDLPGTPYVRASVGAWNDQDDLERLVAAL